MKSGELIAPGVPEAARHSLMNDLVTTYGKTWHTWQVDRQLDFPTGIPQLMMGFVEDGQIDPQLLADRADIPSPELIQGANAWRGGRTLQLRLQ